MVFRIDNRDRGFYEYESVGFGLFETALCSFQAYTILFGRSGITLNTE